MNEVISGFENNITKNLHKDREYKMHIFDRTSISNDGVVQKSFTVVELIC